jgi:glycosyltransferase involved in cell wall biosynthesis
VCFVGHVNQQEVFVHMAAAQVLLFLSQLPAERLPNAVKEAMLFRCACVVTQSKGIEELVKDGHTGYIVRKGDIETAVARINHIFAHPDRTSSMTDGAHAQIVTNFDVDVLTQERIQHWARLLKRFD